MNHRLGLVAYLVQEYDPAIAWFTTVLDFKLEEDRDMGNGKRWVVVRPSGGGAGLLLARGATPHQQSRIGDQTGGRVFLFLETDHFQRDYDTYRARGVVFPEPPREMDYGTVAVFEDLYGNRWDLIQKK